jgi:glycine/D-amino acid oxidase-like deaminating enzyme
MAGSWDIWVRRRRRLVCMGASTRARGTLRSKWSPEKDKNKLVSRRRRRRRKMPEKMRREEIYPEATGLCFLGKGTPIFCLFIV